MTPVGVLIYSRVSRSTDFLSITTRDCMTQSPDWNRETNTNCNLGECRRSRSYKFSMNKPITFCHCLAVLLTLMSISSGAVAKSEALHKAVQSSSKSSAVLKGSPDKTELDIDLDLDRPSISVNPDLSRVDLASMTVRFSLPVSINSMSWEQSQRFISQIFRRYNASHEKSIAVNNFETFMFQIGLGNKIDNLFDKKEHDHDDSKFEEDNHDHDIKKRTVTDEDTTNSQRFQENDIDQSHNVDKNKCLSVEELLKAFSFENKTSLSQSNFLFLCPAILSQLDGEYCRKATLNVDHLHETMGSHDQDHDHEHDHEHDTNLITSMKALPDIKVWVYSFVAVVIISACSVLGTLVIPHVDRVIYNHTLQFLVALAVGALSGDALLHLLPHAVYPHDHEHAGHEGEDDHEHSSHAKHMAALSKGLVALVFIYLFFFMERFLAIFTIAGHRKKLKNRSNIFMKKEGSKRARLLAELTSYPGQSQSCDETVMVVHPNKALKPFSDCKHETLQHQSEASLLSPSRISSHVVDPRQDDATLSRDIEVSKGRGDSHITGNDQNTPADISGHSHSSHGQTYVSLDANRRSSVRVMVVTGDAIHNFFDGVAIGAAFAGNVAQGMNTSLAVFCHELPHELGDIAVLLRSGLSLRKAVYWNLVSCIPCFIGVVVGLLLGGLSFVTPWVFAAVAGMFLYIALVDLVSDMTAVHTKSDEPLYFHLLLQASGIALGTTILLLLGVYEEALLKIFDV